MHVDRFVHFVVLFLALAAGIAAQSPVARRARPATLVIGNALIYTSPTVAPIRNGVIVVRDGLIAQVGPGADIDIPAGAQTLDARGGAVVYGFQNSHIHFSEPQWSRGAAQPSARLSTQFEAMYTRFGFTTVVDVGSSLEDARAIRDRVASGEVTGPRVLTAGIPLYPAGGVPYYIRESVPPDVLRRLHQPAGAEAARLIADGNLNGGADLIKLFTGSWVTSDRAVPMRLDVAVAAVEAAHQRRKLVYAHASNIEGLQVALDAGVDVVAHALDDTRGLTSAHYEQMRARNMAMVPTVLVTSGKAEVVEEVRQFHQAGGLILFGTDAGYIQRYNPVEEYGWLARAGLSWRDVLASLTTNPAAKFGESARRGRVEAGMVADLVVLGSDPASGVQALSDVRATIRNGSMSYSGR